jgi:YkoY family integral membrane protein
MDVLSPVWLHAAGTLAALAVLEAVLSADNAVAIAALVKELEPESLRVRGLNWGLALAFVLRVLMVVLAGWVVRFNAFQLLGGCYLLWLACRHFQEQLDQSSSAISEAPPAANSLLGVIPLVALTDLAFSLDSVTAAVAVTDRLWLVISGGAVGILLLRFLATWVLRWMLQFERLQNAAYLTVLAVGLRLVAKVITPSLTPPEPILLVMVLIFFGWGFSKSSQSPTQLSTDCSLVTELKGPSDHPNSGMGV